MSFVVGFLSVFSVGRCVFKEGKKFLFGMLSKLRGFVV